MATHKVSQLKPPLLDLAVAVVTGVEYQLEGQTVMVGGRFRILTAHPPTQPKANHQPKSMVSAAALMPPQAMQSRLGEHGVNGR